MKYPKIKREQKLNCKLTDSQIQEIKNLYKKGVSQREISRSFGIARKTVKYWVDESYREKDKNRVMAKIKIRRSTIEGKKEDNSKRAKSIALARARIDKLRQYHKIEIDKLNQMVRKKRKIEKELSTVDKQPVVDI